MADLRSTFPLDEGAVTRKALRQILFDPITWVPFVPAVAAYTIFDVPSAMALTLGALVAGGVGAFWVKQWSGLTAPLRRQFITAHNEQQNVALTAGAAELRQRGAPAEAAKLEQFLVEKRKIETRLHEQGRITPEVIQIEQLVDSLCFGVRDQLLARAGKSDPGDAAAPVETALTTLREIVGELDIILGPADPPAGAAGSSLREITDRLREEAEIARRVRRRLRAQDAAMPFVDSPEPPPPAGAPPVEHE